MTDRLLARVWLGVLVLLAVWTPAAAHDRTMSFSAWAVADGRATVTLTVDALDLEAIGLSPSDPKWPRYATENLGLSAGGVAVPPTHEPRHIPAPPGRVRLTWDYTLPAGSAPLAVRSTLFLGWKPGHLHFVSIQHAGRSLDRVLTNVEPSFTPPFGSVVEPASLSGLLVQYAALGGEHILTGYDHLVFLLALLLAARQIRPLVLVVTGFTVGHSVTLAAAALGTVRPQIQAVEALIGVSIVLAAVECGWARSGVDRAISAAVVGALVLLGVAAFIDVGTIPWLCWLGCAIFMACRYSLALHDQADAPTQWPVALIFGLIHGLGFASALVEAGLPDERLLPALVAFNVGVEAAQLALVALIWPLLRMAGSRQPALVQNAGAFLCVALGAFWAAQRGFG